MVTGPGLTIFRGTINDGAGQTSLTLSGGTLTLCGTNTYTGGTFVDGGVLVLTNNEAVADGSSLTVGNPSYFGAVVPASAASAAPPLLVPEPGSLALAAAFAGSAAVARRWRRRRGQSF